MNWIIVAIVLLLVHKEYMASPTPMKLPGHTQKLTPYIRHWEAANFDRAYLHAAHQKHIEQKRHRRKRELKQAEYGPAHTIRLFFFAHDREFRMVLRQNPLSVFAGDVAIENSLGPMDYDISRIYTGSLEDDDNSYIHAILTSDNLLDGTIETSSEQYYLEPSYRYSQELPKSDIHTIIYKVSDVNMQKSAAATPAKSSAAEHCASERLRRSMLLDALKRRKSSDGRERSKPFAVHNINDAGAEKNSLPVLFQRIKRWVPDEITTTSVENHQNPPLPLDLDVPYNDDFSILTHLSNRDNNDNDKKRITDELQQTQKKKIQGASVITWRNSGATLYGNNEEPVGSSNRPGFTPSLVAATTKSTRNRNIIINNYNPSNDESNKNINSNANNNNVRNTYTKHKNIIVSTYNNNNHNNNYNYNSNNNKNKNDNNNNVSLVFEQSDDADASNNYINNFFNTNWTSVFMGDNDRPSHKTHVEIITKNGATKKPNIIVNNYNPDIILAPNPNSPNFNTMFMTNLLSGRGQEAGFETTGRSLYDRKITCMLYLQADHTFFQKMGSDEASIEAITRHVQRANSIYKNTDFNNDGKPDNITFMIKRIKVHNNNAVKDPSYRFPGNYGVEKFLELFSEEDYDAFCLAYMFTYRDFEMGTLGLAWTGDLKNAGGVCEKNGHYRGSLKSLNTGIVTLLNYGKHVPPAVSHVTLAHEIGHNFGSPHDPEQCTPGGEDGNYIMFARATSGDKKNNNKFSPCSLKSIEPVLNAKARSAKGCFTEPQTAICGNGVVEQGEQCDCGWEEDCKDSCCFPMSRHPRIDEKPCTLTPRAMCSPSQGPCCTTDCRLKFGDKCRDDNGCRDPSFCDGRMPQCPPSVNKPNKTICNKEFVCYMGDCTGSICLAYGLESCQCIPGPKDEKIKSCELCCKLPGESNPCRSSFEWNEAPFDVPDMYAKPGTPCNDYNGYCDVFQKCREVDPSGPLATLRKLLLSEESIATFKKWMQHNWYTVALAAIGVFLLLALSTKLLAKRSNLKLKSVTIIHSATTETVRLPEDNNGIIVHTAVRTKVPFKKKVRGERSKNKNGNNNNTNINNNTKFKSKVAVKNGVGKPIHAHGRERNKKMPTTNEAAETGAATAPATKQATTVLAVENNDIKKPQRSKKNRVGGTTTTTVATASQTAVGIAGDAFSNETKSKRKKFRKHSKEIIDYSVRNATQNTATPNTATAGTSGTHTNTFGKVQKWLLESPIVSQPLSHIEHSSKVRKVMSKSQSTPERLVQKSPQKTKSLGNLSNEKVKLQVVYKPPFKFALRLSKNAKVKTNVVNGGAVGKMKRQAAKCVNEGNRLSASNLKNGSGTRRSIGEKTKRAALLLRSTNKDEDNQVLTLYEPNYETLSPKVNATKMENPLYENMQCTQVNKISQDDRRSSIGNGSGTGSDNKVSRSTSKTQLDQLPSHSQSQTMQRTHSYSRSQSLTNNNNPFAAVTGRNTRKLSDSVSQKTNLNQNFGSTQNLIPSNPTNLAKTKKRSSLNLKSKSGKDPPLTLSAKKRSNSNINLGSSVNNLSQEAPNFSLPQQQHNQRLHRSSSNKIQNQQPFDSTLQETTPNSHHQPLRSSRASFSNIPRASLSTANIGNILPAIINNTCSNSLSMNRESPPVFASPSCSTSNAFSIANDISLNHSHPTEQQQHSRNRNSLPLMLTNSTVPPPLQHPQRSNSIRQQPHYFHPPPLPTATKRSELNADMETTGAGVDLINPQQHQQQEPNS